MCFFPPGAVLGYRSKGDEVLEAGGAKSVELFFAGLTRRQDPLHGHACVANPEVRGDGEGGCCTHFRRDRCFPFGGRIGLVCRGASRSSEHEKEKTEASHGEAGKG